MSTITHEEATDGQNKQIIRFASDAAEKAASAYVNANYLSKEGAQRVLASSDFVGRIHAATVLALAELSREIPPKLKLLNSNIELPAVAGHDPHTFFQTRKGLYVWDGFRSRVLSLAKPVSGLGPLSLSSYDLTENLYDRDIKAELPANHVFTDASVLCARIAQLISKQPNGEKGDLLNNGYANLFYLPDCVVDVYWGSVRQGWYVYAWKLDDRHWYAGRRAFSGN